MATVANIAQQLRATRTLFGSSSALSATQIDELKVAARANIVAQLDRLSGIDMAEAGALSVATTESGFDAEAQGMIQSAIAHKCLSSVPYIMHLIACCHCHSSLASLS